VDADERTLDADLRRLARVKRSAPRETAALGPELVSFFKHSVQRRQTKFGKIGECWGRLVPELLNEHCALESFSRGTLVVIVDSSSHLYQLKTLLLAGIQQQLLAACAGTGLKKVTLKPGRWYETSSEEPGERKVRFTCRPEKFRQQAVRPVYKVI
jgi:hypothetical protein